MVKCDKWLRPSFFANFAEFVEFRSALLFSEKNEKVTKNRCGPDFSPFSQNLLNSEASSGK